MKKTVLIVGLVVAALVVLGVGVAFAQGPTPYTGGSMMGGNGGSWIHSYVEQALAAKLGLPEKQVEDQLAAGSPCSKLHSIAASTRKPSPSS